MKRSIFLPIVAASAVSFTACNNEDKSQADAQESADQTVSEVVVGDAMDKLSDNAGFAQYLPKDTSAFWTFYDGSGFAKRMLDSKLGQLVAGMIEQEEGMKVEDLLEIPEFATFAEITGEELFLAFGEGTAEQYDNLMQASHQSNYFQMRMLVNVLAAGVEGDDDAMEAINEDEYLLDWLKSDEAQAIYASSKMPPMYLGFKVSDAEKRAGYVEMIQSASGMVLQEAEELAACFEESEKGTFKGLTLKGAKLVDLIEQEGKDEVVEELGNEFYEKMMKLTSQKDLVMMAGEHEDYVVLFFGSSLDELDLAKSAEESVLAHEGMAYAQKFANKELLSLLYMSDEMAKVAIENQAAFGSMARGIVDGLKETDVFGDTRVLEALLGDLIEREKAYYAPFKAGRVGSVAYFDQGLKFDSFYAGNSPSVDLTSKRRLGSVSEGEGVIFSANWVSDPAQVELGLEYLDAFGSTAYQMTKQMSGLEMDDSDFSDFVAGFSMFEMMLKKELLELWGAFRNDLNEGLGAESALVIDINGELPTVPMIDAELIKEAKMPRFAYVSTVDDRKKLSASWETINGSAEKLLNIVSEMSGTQMPMQRPFKSQNNGLTSWTFPIPTTHQNCTPSVSVSNDLFVLGTSPDFANELAASIDAEAKLAPMSEIRLNLDAIRKLGSNWLGVMDKFGEDMMGGAYADYEEAKPYIEKFMKASEQLESIELYNKLEGGEVRSTLHFKTR